MSIEWLRWYHGTVTDPKLVLISRKSSHSRIAVIAVWAALLEHASQAENRGDVSRFDVETIAVALDVDDDVVRSIMDAMTAKGMIVDGRLAAWEIRQPRREDGSAERAKAWRERKRTQANASERTETKENAEEQIRTLDKEKIREEKNREEKEHKTSRKREDDVFETAFWVRYPKKVGKQDARKAWDKLNPNPDLVETILDAIINQAKDKETKQALGAFFNPWPDPVRWLSNRRWEDEIDATTTQSTLTTQGPKNGRETVGQIQARTDAAFKARFQRENEASQAICTERDISHLGHRVT